MRIFSVVKAILLLHVSYVSLSSARLEASALAIEAPPPVAKQCGFRNGHNICYMNALLAALYDCIYDNFFRSVLPHSLAIVFARKQLAHFPQIDMHRDIMPTISALHPDWEFGHFQDIDEFFRVLSAHLPIQVLQRLGYVKSFQLSAHGYQISRGDETHDSMLMVNFPAGEKSHNLVDLIDASLRVEEEREYRLNRFDHSGFFDRYPGTGRPNEQSRLVTATYRPIPVQYEDIIPVFLVRRTSNLRSNKKDFRTDRVSVPESITFPMEDGTRTGEYNLISFAVYHPGHYLAYSKNYPSRQWHCFNDAEVSVPSMSEIKNELEKHAVMIFYVRKGLSLAPEIPEEVKKWAVSASIAQHHKDRLVPLISKMLLKTKK